ncbi:MAG: aspartate/glutamate racemase family protein [Actinomycetaceae bacterium]|nr:aspartate/glutamate racemase family protein [Actinomycetaceae bacterium]
MKILVANPNRSQELLNQLMESARSRVTNPATQLIPFLNPLGSTHLDCYFADYQATWSFTREVIATVEEQDIDAVVVAGFGNFGVYALKEALNIPVLSIAECSQTLACMLGHKYSVLTVLQQNVPYQEDLVALFRLTDKCASVRGVDINIGDWSTDEGVFHNLKCAITNIVDNDGADVIVLGGARFATYAKRLEKELGITIIDPVLVTVKQAEMMVETGLIHSKKRKFHHPPQPLETYCFMGERHNRFCDKKEKS